MRHFTFLSLFVFFSVPYALGRQWTLIDKAPKGWRSVLTGCLGTASYDYQLPNWQLLQQDREKLLAAARGLNVLDTHAFVTYSEVKPGTQIKQTQYFKMDLATGEVSELKKSSVIPGYPAPDDKNLIFCPCRENNNSQNCGKLNKAMPWAHGTIIL